MPLELVSKQDVDQHVKVSLLGNTQRQRRGAGWLFFYIYLSGPFKQMDTNKQMQANKQTNKAHALTLC